MTKTLTEQWKDGTLPSGEYYIKLDDGSFTTDKYFGKSGGFAEEIPVEVLAPVPSYDKHIELIEKTEQLVQRMHILEKRLAIATKALKETQEKLLHVELSGLDYDNRHKMYDLMFTDGVIDKALKEMEGVK